MMRCYVCLFVASLLMAAAFSGEPSPDVSDAMAKARAAAQEGDALERRIRNALADGSADYTKLLDQQEKAYEKAERTFRDALKAAPDHPEVLAAFGRFWLGRRELGQARKHLEAALRSSKDAAKKGSSAAFLAPEEADVRRTLGGLLERAGDNGGALDQYRKAWALDPGNPRNRLSLAIALCASGAPQDALSLLRPWAEDGANPAAPDKPAKSPSLLALGLYTLAVAQEETGFYEDALATYRRAKTAAEQAGQGDTADVVPRAGPAVARLEDFLDGLRARAEKRAKENEERAKTKLEPLPDERESYTRASMLCDQGCRLKAGALDDPSFVKALAQSRTGGGEADTAALQKHPSFDALLAAMQAFQEAITKAPKLARAYYEFGSCSVILGRLGTARKLLDEAAVCSPNSLAILSLQGEVLLELGQWEEAARAFNRLLELEPESGRANFGVARAYAGLQNGVEQCRKALDALLNAEKLGFRDKRMFETATLVLSDGREVDGYITEEPQAYLVHGSGETVERVEKTAVKELRRQPGLQEQLLALAQRFERGEKPVPGPVLRGSRTPSRPARPARPADSLEPWRGSLIER